MPEKNTCILSYTDIEEAEIAIRKLQAKDFNLVTVSVVGNGYYHEENVVGIYTNDRNIHYQGSQAQNWERLWKQLDGKLFLVVPDIGSLVAAGPIVELLIKEHDHMDIHGFSLLGIAFFTMGVPVDSISYYEEAIRTGKIFLIVNASRIEVERSCNILHSERQRATVHLA